MKKSVCCILFFFILILQNNNSKAQGYIPFLMDSTTWRVHYSYFHFAICEENYVIDYSYNGDTILQSNNYRKVHSVKTLFNHLNGSPSCAQSALRHFFVRQDINSKKVYLVADGDSIEHLLYDFNLYVGDTLFDSYLINQLYCGSNYTVVQSIDSILIDSTYRRRWNFNCIDPVIEGFGSTNNPFANPYLTFEVVCINHKGNTYYGYQLNSFSDSSNNHMYCSFTNSTSELYYNFFDIQFNYNSLNSELLIICKENKYYSSIFNLDIIDISGRLLSKKEIKFSDGNIARIPMTEIANGTYIIQLYNKKTSERISKLIHIN